VEAAKTGKGFIHNTPFPGAVLGRLPRTVLTEGKARKTEKLADIVRLKSRGNKSMVAGRGEEKLASSVVGKAIRVKKGKKPGKKTVPALVKVC